MQCQFFLLENRDKIDYTELDENRQIKKDVDIALSKKDKKFMEEYAKYQNKPAL